MIEPSVNVRAARIGLSSENDWAMSQICWEMSGAHPLQCNSKRALAGPARERPNEENTCFDADAGRVDVAD